ncbi:MAG: hypothetical protein PUB93_03965, partial [Firmicutes bacterium]|nr:hypothetical protein [Bacillota bacterium]
MKIKKLLAIICVAALLVTTLAGCVGKTDKPEGSVPSSGQTQPPTNPTDPGKNPTDPTDASEPSEPVDPMKPAGVIEDFENGLPSGADFYAPNTVPRIEELENGNHVLAGQYSVDGTGW